MQITLNTGNTAMLDSYEPIVLPTALDIEFKSSVYRFDTLVVTARNGDTVEKHLCKQKPYKISLSDVIKAGRVELEISNVISGEAVKTWRVPDIILKEIEHNFAVIPEIEEIKIELAKIKQGMAEILKLI